MFECSILVDGKDASKLSLREVQDSPAEWCKRGKNLLDNKLYGTHRCMAIRAVSSPYLTLLLSCSLVIEAVVEAVAPQLAKCVPYCQTCQYPKACPLQVCQSSAAKVEAGNVHSLMKAHL